MIQEKTLEEMKKEIEDNNERIKLMQLQNEQKNQMEQLNPTKPKDVDKDIKLPYIPGISLTKDTPVMPQTSKRDIIDKKTVALEVFKLHGKIKMLSTISLAGVLCSMLGYQLHPMVGSGFAVILASVLGWFMIVSHKEMIRLKTEYQL